MSILRILQYPDLRLKRKGRVVTDIKSEKIQTIIKDMKETLVNSTNCAALAATQLELAEPPNITVINHSLDSACSKILCLINPKIISQEGKHIDKEGCMSVSATELIYAKIKRATKIRVKALNENGEMIEFDATDFMARCIQHECDHLRGIIYLDYLSKGERARIDKKIAQSNQTLKV